MNSLTPWPASSVESVPWRGREDECYDAAVLPRIANLDVPLRAPVAADVEAATMQLVRFDATATGSHWALLEAVASSRIEGIRASLVDVGAALLGRPSSPEAELVAANQCATTAARHLDISKPALLALHGTLLGGSRPDLAGKYRTGQAWIGGGAFSPHYAVFVPPVATRVRDDMHDWVAFTRRRDIPALAHAALAHAHFETIHPFGDGNGRTGRAIVQAMLGRSVTLNAVAPLSVGIAANVRAYYDALNAYRHGDIEPIVSVFVAAASQVGVLASQFAAELDAIQQEWAPALSRARSHSVVHAIAEHLVHTPVVDVASVVAATRVSKPAAAAGIGFLEGVGILHRADSRERGRVWAAPDVVAAHEDCVPRR